MDLVYPTALAIKIWGDFLVDEVKVPLRFLPVIDEEWSKRMEDCFEITQLHPESDDLCKSAARVFFKIIKKHSNVDGNKRSAILCTYLFILMNGYRLNLKHSEMYEFAKRVARAKPKGQKGDERWIRTIHDVFSQNLELRD